MPSGLTVSARCCTIGDVSAERDDPGGGKILGDLLYPGRDSAIVSETHWRGLLHAVGRGDALAMHALYTQTSRVVFTLIMRIVQNRDTAEEVTLDVFHQIWRRAASYDPSTTSVLGWMMNQARSRAIDRLRFEQRKKRVNTDAVAAPDPDLAADAGDVLDVREQGRLLRDALTMLTPDERQAIELAYFSELTYSEVAVQLNQPLGTIKTRIRSGLGKLRQALGEEFNTL